MTTKHGVEKAYVGELAYRLRMRGVSPDKIGDILAEVETHVATTGEPARAAFGEPREYARTWEPRPQRRRWLAKLCVCLVMGGCAPVPLIVVLGAIDGKPTPGLGVGWWLAGWVSLTVLVSAFLPNQSAAHGRSRIRRVLATAAALCLMPAGYAMVVRNAVLLGGEDPRFGLDHWWVIGLGVALVVAAAAIIPLDSIIDPRSGRPFFSGRRRPILIALAGAVANTALFMVLGLLVRWVSGG